MISSVFFDKITKYISSDSPSIQCFESEDLIQTLSSNESTDLSLYYSSLHHKHQLIFTFFKHYLGLKSAILLIDEANTNSGLMLVDYIAFKLNTDSKRLIAKPIPSDQIKKITDICRSLDQYLYISNQRIIAPECQDWIDQHTQLKTPLIVIGDFDSVTAFSQQDIYKYNKHLIKVVSLNAFIDDLIVGCYG